MSLAPAFDWARVMDDESPDSVAWRVARGRQRTTNDALPPKIIHADEISRDEIEDGKRLYPPEAVDRPYTRGDCLAGGKNAQRPCPFVACRYNLYLDTEIGGVIRMNHPGIEPGEMVESCALDVADRGGSMREEVAPLVNLTRERVRQIEVKGLILLGKRLRIAGVEGEFERREFTDYSG